MGAEYISKEVHTVFDAVIAALETVPAHIVNEVPFEGSWTLGQVAEHIIICSQGVPDSKSQHAERAYDEKAADLRAMFSDRNQKSEADPQVYPKETSHNLRQLIVQLTHNKERLLQIAGGKNLTALCLDMEFPFIGYLTRYEWLTFICIHTQWHLNQITDILRHLEERATN
ncbi:DinB family protein [Parapedobacter deserti]|uniref:DinB family protein n=1 Tax=Parapedobacter deserti TaxID=1912957 RepID=A0ABV7JUX1_9SPHI